MRELGQWYEPDLDAVAPRSDEVRARDERYIHRLRAKGIVDPDPWPTRKHALAVTALLERVLDQFGIGRPVELWTDLDDDPVIAGRIERVGVEDGLVQAVFVDEFAPTGSAPNEADSLDEQVVSVNCKIIERLRVVAR